MSKAQFAMYVIASFIGLVCAVSFLVERSQWWQRWQRHLRADRHSRRLLRDTHKLIAAREYAEKMRQQLGRTMDRSKDARRLEDEDAIKKEASR